MHISKNIGFRIALGFGLLILAVIINTILSARIISDFRQSQNEISNVLYPSIRTLKELRFNLHITGDLLLRLETESLPSSEPALSEINPITENKFPQLHSRIQELSSGWNQRDREQYSELYGYITDSLVLPLNSYYSERDKNIKDTIISDIRTDDLIHACAYSDDQTAELINRFEQLASRASQEAGDNCQLGRKIMLFTGIGIAAAALIIAFLLFYSLVSQIRQYRNVITSMAKGILPEARLREGQDEMGQIGAALNSLIKGLKDLSDFSEEIGKGNFKGDFQPLSEDDILGNSLIRLREDLKSAAIEDVKRQREDERRNWSNQGIARFSDILREYSGNLQELTRHVIAELVKYLEARVGGIFLINQDKDGKDVIEMVAAYAYERQKYLKKKIMPGEGLVGRCIQEGKTIYMTDIPDDYIKIKSGLGEDNPKSLLIVPLKLNEEVMGVIEIASLEIFQDFQIEFIERIGTSMASSIAAFHSDRVKPAD